MKEELERYSRQVLFRELGEEGQRRLMSGRVLVCGCGALGSVIAETLVRAGVGFVRLVDRDFVEWTNLQRQVLFDEQDVEQRLPKAVAAAEKLRRINSRVVVEPHVVDVDYSNVLDLCRDVDLILDGTDNFEVRFLINDASLELGVPWVYGGCVGSHGQQMTIFPGQTACLRCLIESPPAPGTTDTCDTAGVLAPAVNVIASLQSLDALKILAGRADAVAPQLTVVDLWDRTFRTVDLQGLPERTQCPACQRGERAWLSGQHGARSTVLCGRNAVQVSPKEKVSLDLQTLADKLRSAGTVQSNPYLVRVELTEPRLEMTVFRDGRAIVKGTQDESVARTVYSRFVGL